MYAIDPSLGLSVEQIKKYSLYVYVLISFEVK